MSQATTATATPTPMNTALDALERFLDGFDGETDDAAAMGGLLSLVEDVLRARAAPLKYVVVCLDDEPPDGTPPGYVLATRTVFTTRDAGDRYAFGVARSRHPLVVEGAWHDLRRDNNP